MATTDINKEALLRAHRQNLSTYDQQHTEQMIDILGGMNNVLTMILSSTDVSLDQQQLSKLHKIINSRTKISGTSVTDRYREDHSLESMMKFVWTC